MGCGSSIHVPKVVASDEFDVADAGKEDNGLRVLKMVLVGVSLLSLFSFLLSPPGLPHHFVEVQINANPFSFHFIPPHQMVL